MSASLSAGGDPNQEDGESWVVRYVISIKNEGVLAVHGADVNRETPEGLTALHGAITIQDIRAVDALFSTGADVNAGREVAPRPIHIACELDNTDTRASLLERGVDINVRDEQRERPRHIVVVACVNCGE